MPNHLHAIVEIRKPNNGGIGKSRGQINVEPDGDDGESHGPDVEPHGRAVLRRDNNDFPIKRNPPVRLPKSISSFVAGFKSAVNTQIDNYIDEHNLPIPKYNRNNHFFQPNYHDHILKNDFEYQRITYYIIQNPLKWDNDTLNSKR